MYFSVIPLISQGVPQLVDVKI